MSFYETGNPVPSVDPRDLDDNAKHIDEIVNSTLPTFTDRLGAERRTLAGIEADADAIVLRDELADATDPLKGAGLVSRSVVHVDNIKQLMTMPRQSTFAYNLQGYHESSLVSPAENLGGGLFYYRSDLSKTLHEGGVYIDPDRLADYPTDWNNEAQKSTWYAGSSSGTGVFVRVTHRRVEFEQYGASSVLTDNTQPIQKAFSSAIQTVSYSSAIQWSSTVFMDTTGQAFIGPNPPTQYITARRITYNGSAGTWGIQVRAPGCRVAWHSFVGGVSRPNSVLFFRDQAMIPGNADIDGYFEDNILVNFAVAVKFVGRSAWIRNNLFSLHTTGIQLQQFIYTSGVPEYYQTPERGYRGFEATGNRFHASSGVDILNFDTGHENLYGCVINNNNHDTDGEFFKGSLNDSVCGANLVHRLISSKIAFNMYRTRNVAFVGGKIAGEINPLADATFAAAAFKFNTKEVSGLVISGYSVSNVAGIPVQFLEPPEGSVSIDVNSWKDVCYNARAGAQTLPIVDIANVSADGRGTPAFSFQGNNLDLQPISGGATYGSLLRFAVRGSANGVINTMGNTVMAGGTIPETNLVSSSTSLFKRRVPYVGNGSATQTISLPSNPEFVIVSPSSSGAVNRFQTVIAEKGTTATNDVVELTETSVIVKGTYNTLNIVYGIAVY